ncbi:RDD family protein [Streptomyces shenzhenensis]|uniref:RDD family protein n=1 Tax=Streptomyces shenzhenensis TaxID=943815 RepID=UPI0015F039B9|nr:RDD family protein [Streptomyces shenzhenensis]
MSFGAPNNPYGQPQDPQQGQPGYGYPQQPGYQQAPQGVPPQQGYGYPQQPGYPQQGGYGYPQQGYGATPPYANWGQRFGGTIVDGLVFLVPYILVLFSSKAAVLGLIGGLALLGLAIWQLIMEGRTGQTVGKKALGIRLVKEATGQPIGVGMAFVRRIAHILDSLACYLGWLWPAWDAKRQTFADKVCGTIVIRSN